MAVRSTQCQNKGVRSTQGGGGVTLFDDIKETAFKQKCVNCNINCVSLLR